MRVFHFRGLSGLLLLLGLTLFCIACVTLLPSLFVMALWNAVVFELFQGPEIGFFQGSLLWLITALLLMVTVRPDLQLQFGGMEGLDSDRFDPFHGEGEEKKPRPTRRKPAPSKENDKAQHSEHWHQWRKRFMNK